MATIDQQFVEYIVKTLVNNPDKVEIDRQIDEKGVLLSLTVDPEDVGRVIGRRGATAQSIRTLLRALGTKNDARYNLKIVNTDENPRAPREDRYRRDDDYRSREEYSDTPSADDSFTSDDDAPEEEPVVDDSEAEEEASEINDLAEKTRADLADLDDLDI